ncbi:hypothetical protein L3X38_018622 [Prunus dulcis]|uniref:Uncharacterized protein n=1 Tax=Prunus dulcis TaxID=3755 RepID=A0AAD4W9D9_PRUDU|nr:hypothetical protein L3X38_018622 [Prunus dulcis]
MFKIHTWLVGKGGRRREIDRGEDRTTPAASSPFFGEIMAAGGGSWLGLEEYDAPSCLGEADDCVHCKTRQAYKRVKKRLCVKGGSLQAKQVTGNYLLMQLRLLRRSILSDFHYQLIIC